MSFLSFENQLLEGAFVLLRERRTQTRCFLGRRSTQRPLPAKSSYLAVMQPPDSTPTSLQALLGQAQRLHLRARRTVDSAFVGAYRSAFRGAGLAFEEVREYVPGDDVRRIDWNVTARLGRPCTQIFREERDLHLLLLLDVSASQHFGPPGQEKLRAAIELSALLGYTALRAGDSFGLMAFSDQIELYNPPQRGRAAWLRSLRGLLALRPQHRTTDLEFALRTARQRMRQRGVVVLVSDLLQNPATAPVPEAALRQLARRHELITLHLYHPQERFDHNLGILPLRHSESRAPGWLLSPHGPSRRGFADILAHNQAAWQAAHKATGADYLLLPTDTDWHPALLRFLQQRHRRPAR